MIFIVLTAVQRVPILDLLFEVLKDFSVSQAKYRECRHYRCVCEDELILQITNLEIQKWPNKIEIIHDPREISAVRREFSLIRYFIG